MLTRTAAARRLTDDRGTTLAELAVSMVVFGLFGTFLATAVVQSTRLTRESTLRETAVQQASLLVEQITKDLRAAVAVGPVATTATAFTAAGPSAVAFHASSTPHVLRERLFVSAGVLTRETQDPDTGTVFPDLRYTDPTKVHVRPLGPPDLPHTVTFGYVLEGTSTVLPSVSTTPQLQAIAAVEVTVSVDGDGPGRLAPVVLESIVRPYNR